MHDWRKFLQSKLAGLRLESGAREDVIEELAAHLEEAYEGLSGQGMAEELAAQQAMLQVTDWKALQRSIYAAKKKEEQMPNRVRQVWFPGLLTLTLSMGLLTILLKHRLEPQIVSWDGTETILFYVPWLLTLPLFGALGACLSSRAGGSTKAILFAGVFPVLPLAACLFVILPLSFVLDRDVAHAFRIAAFLRALIEWILVPGAALLMGALPVQIWRSHQADSKRLSGA